MFKIGHGARNLSVFAVALGGSLAASEVILRSFVTLPLRRPEPEVRYQFHPVRRFTLLPDQQGYTYGAPFAVDQRGFRRNGKAPAAAGVPIIFALGDSFTFGLGVPDEATWPAQLESRLLGAGRAVSVLNGGTISYGAFQELERFRSSGRAEKPVLLVHGLYWNDYMGDGPPSPGSANPITADGYFAWDQPAERRGLIHRVESTLVSYSALLSMAAKAVSLDDSKSGTSMYGQEFNRMLEHGLTDQNWASIESFYRQLLSTGQRDGFAVFSIIMPIVDIVSRPQASLHPYPLETRRRLEKLGVPYFDAFTLWDEKGYGGRHFLPQGHDAHLNAEGYRLIAAAAASKLLSIEPLRSLRASP